MPEAKVKLKECSLSGLSGGRAGKAGPEPHSEQHKSPRACALSTVLPTCSQSYAGARGCNHTADGPGAELGWGKRLGPSACPLSAQGVL